MSEASHVSKFTMVLIWVWNARKLKKKKKEEDILSFEKR